MKQFIVAKSETKKDAIKPLTVNKTVIYTRETDKYLI